MTRDTPADGQGSRTNVLPLIGNTANQRVLSTWLTENPQYRLVESGLDTATFDLCILDTATLRESESTLRQRKAEADGLLPYLLLVPDSSGAAINEELRQKRPELWELVDGTVRVPLDRYDLSNSVDTLLRLREQSREISRREQQFEMLNRLLRHDIRNDIAVVLGWLDVLSDHVPAEQQSVFDRVKSASNHILDLTNTARNITEAMAGNGETELMPMSLTHVLFDEIEKTQTTYDNATIEPPESPPELTVRANELLSSVFRNLLNNAVQHNDSDDPVVAISVTESDGTARVRIADNGPGVPDAIREEIFENEVKGLESAGSGMGLYLVSTLVDMYDGTIQLETNEPRGSVFVVELPTIESVE